MKIRNWIIAVGAFAFGASLMVMPTLAIWPTAPNPYGTGDILDSSDWNRLVQGMLESQARLGDNIYSNGSSVGVGTGSPTGKFHVLTTGETYSLVVANNGNVGIGTDTPADQLSIANGNWKFNLAAVDTIARGSSAADDGLLHASGDLLFQVDNNNNQIGAVRFFDGTNNPFFTALESGNVGIGVNNPSQSLEVNGTALATAWNTTSDARKKTNIVTLGNALAQVEQLRGVSFDWTDSGNHAVGVIAQEVEQIIPEVVTTDADGYKSVDYAKLTPVLIEAVKELKAENDQLTDAITDLTARIEALEQ